MYDEKETKKSLHWVENPWWQISCIATVVAVVHHPSNVIHAVHCASPVAWSNQFIPCTVSDENVAVAGEFIKVQYEDWVRAGKRTTLLKIIKDQGLYRPTYPKILFNIYMTIYNGIKSIRIPKRQQGKMKWCALRRNTRESTCTHSCQKCWPICDDIVNIVQSVQNSPNDGQNTDQ